MFCGITILSIRYQGVTSFDLLGSSRTVFYTVTNGMPTSCPPCGLKRPGP